MQTVKTYIKEHNVALKIKLTTSTHETFEISALEISKIQGWIRHI